MDDIPTPASSETSAFNQKINSEDASPDPPSRKNASSTPTADHDVSAASVQAAQVETPVQSVIQGQIEAQAQNPTPVQSTTSTPTATSAPNIALPNTLTWTVPSSNQTPPRATSSGENIPTRIRWTEEMTKTLLTTLVQKVVRHGMRNDTGYQKLVWRQTREIVQQVAGDSMTVTEQHCKSKHDSCKLDWKAWEKLKEIPGFAMNEDGCATISSPEIEAHFMEHKEARKFFKQAFPFEDLHAQLFGGVPNALSQSRKRPGSTSIDETRRDGIAPPDRASAPIPADQTSIPTSTAQPESTPPILNPGPSAENQQRQIISDLARKMGDHATAMKITAANTPIQHHEPTPAPTASNHEARQEAHPVPVSQSRGVVPSTYPPRVVAPVNPQYQVETPRFNGPTTHHQYNTPPPTHQLNGPLLPNSHYSHPPAPQPVAPSPTHPHGYPTFPTQYAHKAYPSPSPYPPPTPTHTTHSIDPPPTDQLNKTLQSFSSKLATLSDAMSRQNPNLETQRAAQVLMERTYTMDEELQVAMAMHIFNQDALATSFLAWGSVATQKLWVKKQLERLLREGILEGSQGVEEKIRGVRVKGEYM
ncbi:hypothetical protein DM02DRAFT_609686, partial [Periconia macrospinosa]